MSPGSVARLRRSTQKAINPTDTGMSWNRQNSEVRSSRKAYELGMGGTGMDSRASMGVTGNSWVDRQQRQEQQSQGLLPDINMHKGRGRPNQMGDTFISQGRMSGAAGFKRDSVHSGTGFSYQHQPETQTRYSGIGGNFGVNQPTDDMASENRGSAIGHVMGSPARSSRRNITQRNMSELQASMESGAAQKDRPPLYVPTKREPGQGRTVGLRESLNANNIPPKESSAGAYQPKTPFSYQPSAEVQAQQKQSAMFGRQNSSRGSSGSRYQPSQMDKPHAAQSAMSRVDYMPSPASSKPALLSKPPTKPKPAVAPPPVATFQIKQNDYT